MTIDMWMGLLGTVQALGMAWINHTVKTNACGGAKCLKMIQAASLLTTGAKVAPYKE